MKYSLVKVCCWVGHTVLSHFVIGLKWRESGDELVVRDDTVLVLVKSLIEESEALLARVHICLLEELAHIVQRRIALLFFVDVAKGHVKLHLSLVHDPLAD